MVLSVDSAVRADLLGEIAAAIGRVADLTRPDRPARVVDLDEA